MLAIGYCNTVYGRVEKQVFSFKHKNITTRKFLKYCVVGGTGAVLSWVSIYLLTEVAHFWYMMSAVVTTFIVVVYNFTLNALWTFKE